MSATSDNAGDETAPQNNAHDHIDDTSAPLIEHLAELRLRLIYAFLAFGAAFILCFAFAREIYNILFWPFVNVVGADKAKAIYTHLLEKFFVDIKVAMFGAAFLSLPIVLIQVYKFVAPGLYTTEKAAFRPYLIATPVLFALGAAMVYFVAMPFLVRFSVGFEQAALPNQAEIALLPKVSEYLSLVMSLTLGFGICFQLPVLLTLLARAGIVTAAQLRSYRKFALVAICAVAAILTPPDVISMILMAIPTYLLFEVSIFVVARVEGATPDA